MMYLFRCYVHGDFTIEAPIAEGPNEIVYCPSCHEESLRVFENPSIQWKTNGAHGRSGLYLGDYQGNRHKEDILRESIDGPISVPKDVK